MTPKEHKELQEKLNANRKFTENWRKAPTLVRGWIALAYVSKLLI